jgi:hypothetical protein
MIICLIEFSMCINQRSLQQLLKKKLVRNIFSTAQNTYWVTPTPKHTHKIELKNNQNYICEIYIIYLFITERRQSKRFSKVETLMILRSFILHPADYEMILSEIKSNLDQLDLSVRDVYEHEDNKKAMTMIREKIHRLKTNYHHEKDPEIRYILYLRLPLSILLML